MVDSIPSKFKPASLFSERDIAVAEPDVTLILYITELALYQTEYMQVSTVQ